MIEGQEDVTWEDWVALAVAGALLVVAGIAVAQYRSARIR